MVDEPRLADWQVKCIENLLGLEGVEPALLITNAESERTWLKKFLRALFSRDFPFLVFKKLFVKAASIRMRARLTECRYCRAGSLRRAVSPSISPRKTWR
jgi:hypothetical protein